MNTTTLNHQGLATEPATDPMVDGIPLSGWLSPELRPKAVGVYKTQYQVIDEHGDAKVEIGYSKWNGESWGPQFDTAEAAEGSGDAANFPAPNFYRGLVSEHPAHQL